MVGAGREAVVLALLAGVHVIVVAAGDDASLGDPAERGALLAAVAALGHAAGEAVAAGGDVHRGVDLGVLGEDAATVGERLAGRHSPAGAARRLIADQADHGVAALALRAPVKVGGEVGDGERRVKAELLVGRLGDVHLDVVRVAGQAGPAERGDI